MNPVLIKQEIHRLLQNNQTAKARDICDQLCELAPNDIDVWLISASIYAKASALGNVVECCKKVIKLQPNHVLAYYNLAIAQQSMGDYASAEKNYQITLQLNPGMKSAIVSLANVVMNLGRSEEAIRLCNSILSKSGYSDPAVILKANINLSLALCVQKRFSESEQACKNALAIDPDSAEALNNLGRALKEQGNLEGATNAHRRAVKVNSGFVVAHSNLLLDLNYLTNIDSREVLSEHRHWEQLHASSFSVKQYTGSGCDYAKRLKVGYVSPDFRAHSVILFISGLIETHDRNNVEVFCYSNVKNPDAWTLHISNTCDHWRDISKINDDQFVAMIEKDKIDILIDLSGHTADNRLLAFARKPAPVQVTWLGYPNTTGMTAIDYRITDAWADPHGESDNLCAETLVRLPHGFLCYRPLDDSPPVNELPMLHNVGITFGCFNNSAKVNDDVIKLWSRLLRKLPDSRLLLKSPQFSDPPLKERYLSKFKEQGIDSQRIEIHGRIASTVEHLSLYHKVDLALDPFPYNGTTTTCEALWMGVPVVVLEGTNHAGRVGVSLLENIRLPELIAKSKDDYVRICLDLADNPSSLSRLRAGMRALMRNAPLLNAEKFAKHIEEAYRDMWVKHCE